VTACQDLPGQELFQYLDEQGESLPIGSTDVNEYLRIAARGEISAKDFRTWAGTLPPSGPSVRPSSHRALRRVDRLAVPRSSSRKRSGTRRP